jgi:hypothetical protein
LNWEFIKPINQVLYIWNLLTTHYGVQTLKKKKTPTELVASISTNIVEDVTTVKLNTLKFPCLTLEAPVVLHYLKAPTAVKLTGVCFIAF